MKALLSFLRSAKGRNVLLIAVACIAIVFLALWVGKIYDPDPLPLTEIEIPFTGESVVSDIKGQPYRYFRYETHEQADVDIRKVSPDGKKIAGKRMPWDGPVHIYHLARRIVIYVGDHPAVLDTIEEVFGPQVAGDPR